jgi:hypothetical protein
LSPSWAADRAEADAHQRFRHEQALNEVIERRNPNLQPTALYRQPLIPASSPIFFTATSYWNYRTLKERGKYDPNVRVVPALP